MLKIETYNNITLLKSGRGFLGIYVYPVYSYLIDDLLIDSGTKICQKQFLNFFHDKSLNIVINTHSHEDHIGNNATLPEKKGVTIYAHKEALKFIEEPSLLDLRRYQKFTWGLPNPSQPHEIASEIAIKNYHLQVIHTPGHSIGHICLYEPSKKWLFSGDLHLGKLSLEAQPFEDLIQIIASLKKLADYDVEEIFCGHQGHLSNGNDLILNKLNYLEDAREKAEEFYADNVPLKEITRRIAGKESIMKWITRGHMSKLNGIKSLLQIQ